MPAPTPTPQMIPIIILGAGASTGYVSPDYDMRDQRWKPPLSNNIFNIKYSSFFDRYPEMKNLASEAMRSVPHRESFEQYLTRIKEKRASSDKDKQTQLMILGYYLQELFFTISQEYGNQHINSYRSLIEIVKEYGGEALIIDFNYDLLFEQNISEIDDRIDSYVSGPIKVVKLHGSCDWVYSVRKMFSDETSSYSFIKEDPWFFTHPLNQKPKLLEFRRPNIGSLYNLNNDRLNYYLFPAIAVPLIEKNSFICPELHVEALKSALKSTDKILSIGWRGTEKNFIDLLSTELKQNVNFTIVSSGRPSAEKTMANLSHISKLNFTLSSQEGFVNFIKSEEVDDFFKGGEKNDKASNN